MAIKEAILVISAILAVAAAYPYNDKADVAAALSCNNVALYNAFIGSDKFSLKGCTRNGRLCIDGLPNRCGPIVGQCYDLYWFTGLFKWASIICQNAFAEGHCYKPANPSAPYYIKLLNCNEVWAQENTDDEVEGVKICETDAEGVEHCRSLSEGINARLMQEQPDCFCVKDSAGHKVCEPDNCDAGREAPLQL